jgi:acetylornithine/succinyldiaminopimelate/putrescine aminotransferase
VIKNVNARGMIGGIIFNNVELANKIVENCTKDGVLVVWTKRESIKLGPPLTITIEALKEVFEVLNFNIKKEINELNIQ